MLNKIVILNLPDADKFKVSEEIGCHKERLVCILVEVIKNCVFLSMKFR